MPWYADLETGELRQFDELAGQPSIIETPVLLQWQERAASALVEGSELSAAVSPAVRTRRWYRTPLHEQWLQDFIFAWEREQADLGAWGLRGPFETASARVLARYQTEQVDLERDPAGCESILTFHVRGGQTWRVRLADSTWLQWVSSNYVTSATTNVYTTYTDPNTANDSVTTWRLWISSGTTTASPQAWQPTAEYGRTEETAEARAIREWLWAEDAYVRRWLDAESRWQRQQASERAEMLLLEHLSEQQRAEWRENGYFTVVGGSGRRYRIKRGRQHNIDELDSNGRRIANLCGHVGDAVPDEDNVLIQKLMLETDEEQFRRIANISRVAAG